mmetsp:Transcript_41260/g.109239  ORF Transcript_41260/g.109239 Transcript_41260/m.109239 type:complete len:134 (-) Transcript_41260:464-865(-)
MKRRGSNRTAAHLQLRAGLLPYSHSSNISTERRRCKCGPSERSTEVHVPLETADPSVSQRQKNCLPNPAREASTGEQANPKRGVHPPSTSDDSREREDVPKQGVVSPSQSDSTREREAPKEGVASAWHSDSNL